MINKQNTETMINQMTPSQVETVEMFKKSYKKYEGDFVVLEIVNGIVYGEGVYPSWKQECKIGKCGGVTWNKIKTTLDGTPIAW